MSIWRMHFRVENHMPKNMPKIHRNIERVMMELGREAATSARRSIQRKSKAAAKGRPPRSVTGKLKAGIDFTVRSNVLYFGVKPASTNPPKGSRKRGVVQWLEDNHPFMRPAFKRAINRLGLILKRFPLTRH